MIGYWLIVCHLIGDYCLQSDWMAQEKTKDGIPAAIHATTYAIPFGILMWLQGLFSWNNFYVLGIIMLTHFFIDRFRLARHVGWLKNFLSPGWQKSKRIITSAAPISMDFVVGGKVNITGATGDNNGPFEIKGVSVGCRAEVVKETSAWWFPWKDCVGTGYHKDRPAWLAVWLMIITDNCFHMLINGLAWNLL